jgi:transcriptional regulator with XRE-family HTH domain
MAAGMSLATLAKELHYSKGYLSKIETGQSTASEQVARRADAALGAGGALAKMVDTETATETPFTQLRSSVTPSRRDLLQFGGALLLPLAIPRGNAEAITEDSATAQFYREQFDQLRLRGQRSAPTIVLRSVVTEFWSLVELADAARHPTAQSHLRILAARYAEFAGWMAQEAGQRAVALEWTRWSAAVAQESGDPSLAAYAAVREAELAMYEHRGRQTVELARSVHRYPDVSSRIRGLAAHREAQGHALLGDYRACQAALDQAEQLLNEPAPAGPGGPTLGSTTVQDLGLAVSGWCMYDLGRPKLATESLERVLARTTPAGLRAQALYGARLALAYEAAGDLDRMCDVAARVIEVARPLGSGTVQAELRALARTVARWHSYQPVRQLQVEINAALVD